MRTAIIGLGRMGLRHLQVVRDSGNTVVAVVDPQAEAVLRAQMAFGIAPSECFRDAGAMFGTVQPECVIIATTAPSHCELTCRAAAAGARYILCEKPMAVSLRQCDEMLTACARSGARLAINHQMRFMEQYTKPKALMESPALGGLKSVTVVSGNFGLAMNGSHYFEMFRFLTGECATSVSARFSPGNVQNPRGPQFLDRAGTVRLETASGKRFYMDASSDQGHGMLVVYSGRNGRVTVDELAGRIQIVARRAEGWAEPTTRYGMPWDEEEIAIPPTDPVGPTRSVLQALLAGNDYPDGEIGRQAVRTLVAAYLSDELVGQAVDPAAAALPYDRVYPWA